MPKKSSKMRSAGKKKSGPDRPRRSIPAKLPETTRPSPVFPIVGIGASAGGLEALDAFLRAFPVDCGFAFVVVQHLDPTHDDMLADLLQRATKMRVRQVTDRLRIEADCVYVIPPNRDMSIAEGMLYLREPSAPRGLRLPIDGFLRSLANYAGELAVAVILSGMGTDGTLGLRAIKEKGGVVFVQDPSSAKFTGMPVSAIEGGWADVVAPVEALPEKILGYTSHRRISGSSIDDSSDEPTAGSRSAVDEILILLRTHTGHDFSLYKKSTVYRRIERRMGLHQIDRIADYVRHLRNHAPEIDLLFRDLLIGVTSFFRDAAAWEELREKYLPALVQSRPPGTPIRAWVAGCASGEEAYSLAILLREVIDESPVTPKNTIQLFATDLDPGAIEKARIGVYSANIVADVSAERIRRHFVQVENGWQVGKAIRESVIFAQHNVVMDPPFTKLDFVGCRNMLIYLTTALQMKLLPLFHYSLNSGGLLFLGSSETVGGASKLFGPAEGKARIYRKIDGRSRPDGVDFPSAFRPTAYRDRQANVTLAPLKLQEEAERFLRDHFAPTAVFANQKGDIVYISGKVGAYFEPASGKADWNILVMAREGLKYPLGEAFRKALRRKSTVEVDGIELENRGRTLAIDLVVQSIREPEPLQGLVVVVIEKSAAMKSRGGASAKKNAGSKSIHKDRVIESLRAELLSTRAENDDSRSELRTANEELQSTNEELQSTNEEITTSKEEMQSMNEELQTVNHELRARVEDLSRIGDDMRNLLEATDIATVFLDTALCVRLFTAGTKRIFNLIPGDVGRPMTDFASRLDDTDLAEGAREVLRTLAPKELIASARDDRRFLVRIMPYRTLAEMVDGVVITFQDIGASKLLEEKLVGRRADAPLVSSEFPASPTDGAVTPSEFPSTARSRTEPKNEEPRSRIRRSVD